MKKLIFLLLAFVTFTMHSQTANGSETPVEGLLITNPQTVTTSDNITTMSNTGVLGKINGENISLDVIPPVTHFTPVTNNIKGYFQGVDDALGNIVSTTAGITTRLWFTADQTTITAGTFYRTNFVNKGATASALPVPSVINNDNEKKYFTQDLIGDAYVSNTTFPKGVYAGNLSVSTTPNSAQQRFTVEVYRCNNAGTPIASGISGAIVGDLGVTVITTLDSGVLTLADGSVTNVPVSASIEFPFTINIGERVRYHISAEKVGTTGASITESLYLGNSYNSYIDVPVPLNTTAVQNLSNVAGTTTTDALNALNSKSTHTTPEEFGAAADGIADDKTPIQNAINSGKMVLFNGNYYTSGTITISNKTTIIGNGKISTTSNLPIFDIKANDIVVDGIRLEGNGRGSVTNYITTRPFQIGINLEGVVDITVYKNVRISNVSFFNLGGAGIKIASNKNVNNEGNTIISNCYADSCYIGYFLAERGEYNSFSNIKAYGGEYGVYDIGGNNPFSNSTFERNRTGMYYTTGANPGHSTISGGSINHNIDKGVDVVSLGDGQLFNGVQILNNDIYISGSGNNQFLNCNISSINISITTSTNTNFKNCKFTMTPSVFTGISSCLFSSTEWSGSPPVGFTDTNEQPLNVVKKLSVNTGFTATLSIPSQFNGSFDFGNGSSSLGIPTLVGKSNDSTGLTFISAANDSNASSDMIFNVRENDNTDFSTLTTVAFRFSRFGTNLLDIYRNGNAAFTGNVITIPATTANHAVTLGQLGVLPKKYTALISQTGTSAPVVTVLENTLGSTVSHNRTAPGVFSCGFTNAFVSGKTTATLSIGSNIGGTEILHNRAYFTNVNTVTYGSYDSGTPTDSRLNSAVLEIRVYP